jgi:hypothetical protein
MSGWELRNRIISPIPQVAVSSSTSMDPTPDSPSIRSDRDLRLQALENAILGIGQRLDQICLAPQSPPLVTSPTPSRHLVPEYSAPIPPSPDIRVRNGRYSHVLSVDTYRLRDRTPNLRPDQVTNLSSAANQIRPRLDGCLFNGDPPLTILPFLHQLVRVADQSHMSEATLLWVAEDFLRPSVKEAFRAQQPESWPNAVHWLLLT